MILKALYDYYHRLQAIDNSLAPFGFKHQKIHFVLVVDRDGRLLDIEDMRIDKKTTKTFLAVDASRTAGIKAYMMYDNAMYVLNHPKEDTDKEKENARKRNEAFINECRRLKDKYPENEEFAAVVKFYENDGINAVKQHDMWPDILKVTGANFSFRLAGRLNIAASSDDLKNEIDTGTENTPDNNHPVCLITGNKEAPQEILSPTPIAGGKSNGKLVAFQVSSGYDSYGHQKGLNAPSSKSAAAAFSTALLSLLDRNSHNKISVGSRTFVFWSSVPSEDEKIVTEGIGSIFGFAPQSIDDPNAGVDKVREDFKTLYNGLRASGSQDSFYFLGLAPNAARIAVVYWQECMLTQFLSNILRHFADMEIIDTRKTKKPYAGLYSMLAAAKSKKEKELPQPNLIEAVIKSILQGIPYPATLYNSVLRRIRMENDPSVTRIAVIKAYINRLSETKQKITIMLNPSETNIGYVAGRLFAVFDRIQYRANGINTIRERYMNAASATPAVVFPTLFNLNNHHLQKLDKGLQVYYDKIKQEIMSLLPSDGFPSHLNLKDQGRFFVGYYHQNAKFFEKQNTENE